MGETTALVAKNRSQAFELGEKWAGLPHGWIQWKGTDVCMDFHCKCGAHGHFDGDFAYELQCPHCGTIYSLNGHIQFIEITTPEYPEMTQVARPDSDYCDEEGNPVPIEKQCERSHDEVVD